MWDEGMGNDRWRSFWRGDDDHLRKQQNHRTVAAYQRRKRRRASCSPTKHGKHGKKPDKVSAPEPRIAWQKRHTRMEIHLNVHTADETPQSNALLFDLRHPTRLAPAEEIPSTMLHVRLRCH
jgi:hypothetical protein